MKNIFNKVAVIGAGCCKFGENWDKGRDEMVIDAVKEALTDAKVELKDIEAAWVSSEREVGAGTHISSALKLHSIPISHCENWCASGIDTFRNACFSVASGAYNLVLVVGYEKPKDLAVRGLITPYPGIGGHPMILSEASPPPQFGLMASKYMEHWSIDRTPMAKIAVKNHFNGSMNPKAHLQNQITLEQALDAPIISWPFGLFDCCGVSDGAAAVIITKSEIASRFRSDYVIVRGIGVSTSSLAPAYRPGYEFNGFTETEVAALQAYEQAGIKDPRKEIDCAEIHDCFTMTEIVDYEDLHFCERGHGWRLIEEGVTTLEGDLPVNMSGGLKCFGHPVGATGVRMVYEIYKQLQGKCGKRQVKNAQVGLAQTVGGFPQVAGVVVLGNP